MPTLTITTTAPQAARLATAVGVKLGLKNGDGTPRDATAAEVQADVVAYLRAVVQDQERLAAEIARAKPAFDPT